MKKYRKTLAALLIVAMLCLAAVLPYHVWISFAKRQVSRGVFLPAGVTAAWDYPDRWSSPHVNTTFEIAGTHAELTELLSEEHRARGWTEREVRSWDDRTDEIPSGSLNVYQTRLMFQSKRGRWLTIWIMGPEGHPKRMKVRWNSATGRKWTPWGYPLPSSPID